MINKLNRIIGILVFLICWEILSNISNSPAMPNLFDVIGELVTILSDHNTIMHTAASLKIVFIGILIAIVFGFTLGVIMSRYKKVMIALMPIIETLRGVAALTLFPLLIVVAGMSDASRIFVIFWTSWPAILISTISGLETDKTLIEAAQNLGATENQIMRMVRIPLALPSIANGIRVGISGGWISLIAAEMLGATKGIGYMLLWNSQAFNFKAVYSYIIIIAILGGLMNYGMLKIENKIKEKYK